MWSVVLHHPTGQSLAECPDGEAGSTYAFILAISWGFGRAFGLALRVKRSFEASSPCTLGGATPPEAIGWVVWLLMGSKAGWTRWCERVEEIVEDAVTEIL